MTEKPEVGDPRVAEAVDIINSSASIDYAASVARDLATEAWKTLDSALPESEAKRKLKAFAYYLIERDI